MEKGKSKLFAAFAFATTMFDSESNGYIRTLIRIQNESMVKRIITGQSRGVSPDIIVRLWECSICHNDFEKCDHKEGALYDGSPCQLVARNIEFTGASLVDEPKDPRCRVNDLLVISKENKNNLFEWYGFELHTENVRFKDISEARKRGLISQKAAFKLSELFSVNLYGGARWYQGVSDKIRVQTASTLIIDSKWESLADNQSKGVEQSWKMTK